MGERCRSDHVDAISFRFIPLQVTITGGIVVGNPLRDNTDRLVRFGMARFGRTRELATPDVVWVTPETPAIEIAQRMQAVTDRVLVGSRGKLEGIVSSFGARDREAHFTVDFVPPGEKQLARPWRDV